MKNLVLTENVLRNLHTACVLGIHTHTHTPRSIEMYECVGYVCTSIIAKLKKCVQFVRKIYIQIRFRFQFRVPQTFDKSVEGRALI